MLCLLLIVSFLLTMVGAVLYVKAPYARVVVDDITDDSLEPDDPDYDDVEEDRAASNVRPTTINWGGATFKGLVQVPNDTTVYRQADTSMTVGINNSTSDGNNGVTSRPRAELSIQNASQYMKSTQYDVKVTGRSTDLKTVHVTQVKSATSGLPALAVGVGNPKGNDNSYGYLTVVTGSKKQWVNSDGSLSSTFDEKKAVRADQTNNIRVDFPNSNQATLYVNGNKVKTVSGVAGDNFKAGTYAGASTLPGGSGVTTQFTNISTQPR